LERLRLRINEFRRLTKDAIKLASSRVASSEAAQDLEIIQACADGLYEALEACWKCDCDQPHPANIQLERWPVCTEGGGDTVRVNFQFLFADDAQHAQHDHWMTAEIKHSRGSAQGVQAMLFDPLGGAAGLSAVTIPIRSVSSLRYIHWSLQATQTLQQLIFDPVIHPPWYRAFHRADHQHPCLSQRSPARATHKLRATTSVTLSEAPKNLRPRLDVD
jgi:hypothetical protein